MICGRLCPAYILHPPPFSGQATPIRWMFAGCIPLDSSVIRLERSRAPLPRERTLRRRERTLRPRERTLYHANARYVVATIPEGSRRRFELLEYHHETYNCYQQCHLDRLGNLLQPKTLFCVPPSLSLILKSTTDVSSCIVSCNIWFSGMQKIRYFSIHL